MQLSLVILCFVCRIRYSIFKLNYFLGINGDLMLLLMERDTVRESSLQKSVVATKTSHYGLMIHQLGVFYFPNERISAR